MKEIQQLLDITATLKKKYQRGFPLDGRLVGDIGEVLAAEKYGLTLLPENTPLHDAIQNTTGKHVQIKSTLKNNCYFPHTHIPEYFLAIHLLPNGDIEELYNGTGLFLHQEYILKRNLKAYKNSYYTLSKGILKSLNKQVSKEDKIKEVTIKV